jgi:hypothetical protein
MITTDIITIKISEIDAKMMAAFTSKDASYDKQKEELTFVVENATQKAFRLVWEDKKYFALIEGTDKTITSTLHIIEEFETEEQALDRIEILGLEYDPPDKP